MSTSTNHRIFYIDLLRVLASIAVVVIHSKSFYTTQDNGIFLQGVIWDCIAKLGVPIFVMISGALFLDENRILPGNKMIKYIKNIFYLLICWSFIYAVLILEIWPHLSGNYTAFSWKIFLGNLIWGYGHLWYLFMAIGLYLITPILRCWVKKANSKIVLYFIILSLIFQFCIPIPNYYLNKLGYTHNFLQDYTDYFKIGFITQYTTYYVSGWYLANIELKNIHKKIIYITGLLSLILTIFAVYISGIEHFMPNFKVFSSNLSIHILTYSWAIFLWFKEHIAHDYSSKCSSYVNLLSQLSLGLYLIHPAILYFFRIFVHDKFILYNTPLVALITIIISYIIIYSISKIPVLKLLVRG